MTSSSIVEVRARDIGRDRHFHTTKLRSPWGAAVVFVIGLNALAAALQLTLREPDLAFAHPENVQTLPIASPTELPASAPPFSRPQQDSGDHGASDPIEAPKPLPVPTPMTSTAESSSVPPKTGSLLPSERETSTTPGPSNDHSKNHDDSGSPDTPSAPRSVTDSTSRAPARVDTPRTEPKDTTNGGRVLLVVVLTPALAGQSEEILVELRKVQTKFRNELVGGRIYLATKNSDELHAWDELVPPTGSAQQFDDERPAEMFSQVQDSVARLLRTNRGASRPPRTAIVWQTNTNPEASDWTSGPERDETHDVVLFFAGPYAQSVNTQELIRWFGERRVVSLGHDPVARDILSNLVGNWSRE